MCSEVAQQAKLPTVNDPKLWVVKCSTGKEKDAVRALMEKGIHLAKQGKPLMIKSALCTDTKGERGADGGGRERKERKSRMRLVVEML